MLTGYETTKRARALRKDAPVAEKRLWYRLNNRQLGGFKFVRQYPIGPYFADFCCREAMLIVEIDGWTHSTGTELAHDERRECFLAELGYRIIRFTNAEVLENIDGVLETILFRLDPQQSSLG